MNKRILVVDGQKDNRQIIRDMLAGTDYEITEAEDGEQALAAVAKARPDLILMGIQLPIMDGYEVTRQIKANPGMHRFRSSPSPPTRWMAKNGQRERQDVMTTCRSLTARANYWQKFSSAYPNKCDRLLHRIMSAFGA
jgi:CheY-like chemotaxis protein